MFTGMKDLTVYYKTYFPVNLPLSSGKKFLSIGCQHKYSEVAKHLSVIFMYSEMIQASAKLEDCAIHVCACSNGCGC